MNLRLHRLGGEGERSGSERGLLLWDLYCLCGSDDGTTLGRRCGGAAVGSRGEGRGGGEGSGLDRVWIISRGGRFSGGSFGSGRLVVVHLEDVLLQVSDPVLLHRQRTVKLNLAEPDAHRKTHVRRERDKICNIHSSRAFTQTNKIKSLENICSEQPQSEIKSLLERRRHIISSKNGNEGTCCHAVSSGRHS